MSPTARVLCWRATGWAGEVENGRYTGWRDLIMWPLQLAVTCLYAY